MALVDTDQVQEPHQHQMGLVDLDTVMGQLALLMVSVVIGIVTEQPQLPTVLVAGETAMVVIAHLMALAVFVAINFKLKVDTIRNKAYFSERYPQKI